MALTAEVQHDRTATAKAPGADIRESAPKAAKLPEAPLGVDPWWEEREELKGPLRKTFGAGSPQEVAAGKNTDSDIYIPAVGPRDLVTYVAGRTVDVPTHVHSHACIYMLAHTHT